MRLKEAISPDAGNGNGVYISLNLKTSSGKKIVDALSTLLGGDILDISDMHVTMMYDKEGEIPEGFIMRDGIIEYDGVYGAELFGEDENVLVLTLESNSEINKRHARLRAYGLKHSYDEFKPHITLSYDFDMKGHATNFLDFVKEAANQRLGRLQFTGENVSAVVDNWADDKKGDS